MLLQVQIFDMCPMIAFFFLIILFLLIFLGIVNTNFLLLCDTVQKDFSNWMEPERKIIFFYCYVYLVSTINFRHYLKCTFNLRPVIPIIYPSGACTILLVSTSPAPLQSYLSIIFGFPSEVSYIKCICYKIEHFI